MASPSIEELERQEAEFVKEWMPCPSAGARTIGPFFAARFGISEAMCPTCGCLQPTTSRSYWREFDYHHTRRIAEKDAANA